MRSIALNRVLERINTGTLGREMGLVGILLVATALSAHVRFPLPFTPVPVTLQTLVVLVAGGLLGSRRGALCQGLYLSLASLGLPVVAGPTLFGPTGGYLLGFVAAAAIMGYSAARGNWRWLVGGVFAASLAIYACGVSWLCLTTGQSLQWGLHLGVAPFIGGDVIKAVAAISLIAAGRSTVSRWLQA